MITTFLDYIKENNSYGVGDIVIIEKDNILTPVKIIKRYEKNSFLITYNIPQSLIKLKDEVINTSKILDIYISIDQYCDKTCRYTQNPSINPDVSNIIPISNSKTLSNDISI